MAEVVAGLLVSGLVGIAKDKLGSAIGGQASLVWNFDDDLKEMKDHLETISAVLMDAEKRSITEERVRLLLKRLKHAAIDITDMLEEYQDSSDQAKEKMPGVLSCLPMSYTKIVMANRMKSLREKLGEIVKEVGNFNFANGSRTNNEQPNDERETVSYLPEEPIVGRDGEKHEIINLLSANTNNDDEIVIVAIYGLGGMGKSTLAQLVYNDALFKKYDYRIWVYVSQDFNLRNIGTSIISQLQPQGGQQNMHTQQVINQCLESLLHGKKVLVVLDDLWEERETELDKLRRMLHIKGSRVHVIVTTRNEEIARIVSTGRPYELQSLEDGECWQIIKSCSKFELKSNHENMEQVGLDIAKKCGGVALAAQAVGFVLRSIDDLSGWTNINNSDIWNGSSRASDVLPSLKLSYERMPPELRVCFSYCAIFSKGHNIVEDDLIQQWIALDFIEQSKAGKECINKLLGMSFLQVSKLPSTSQLQVVRYTMHDLVHDLARSTVADELMVSDVAPERSTSDHKYRRYSLLRRYDGTMKLASILPSNMRAVRFSESGELDIPSGAFSFLKYLRILDFSECSGIMLPPSFGRMKQLRCLIAPRMKNGSLPECITELSKLQYLNINGSSKITELPRSIGKLGCLQYLCLSGCSGISKLESFGDLKCMVHLDMSGCSGLIELPDSLGNLIHLQHLKLSGCRSVKAVPQSLCGLTQLQYLNLSAWFWLEGLPEGIGSLVNLQYLNLSGCHHIKELPESLMRLQSLLHLNLSSSGIRSLACLRGLTALQHLNISGLYYCQPKDFLDDFIANLTNLEYLDLSCYSDLQSLPESIGNLTRLHKLDLSHCRNLKFLPESIGTLGLKSLLLDGCSDELLDQASSLVNFSQTLPVFKVRADEVNGCSNVHMLENVNVSELRICSLENVRSLEEATKVKLSDKHNLLRLTLVWSTKRAAQSLWDKDLLEQLVPPAGLKSMCLQGYSCTSFPDWLMCIYRHLTNLVSIQLEDMPMCRELPPLGQLPHLEKLTLRNLPGIKRIDREFCGGRRAFRRLSSFDVSDMKGLEEWNTTYSDEDGVEEFMFPVLDTLDIQDCPGLRLKPCPPTFCKCNILSSDQVISSLEEVDKTSQHCSSSTEAIKLNLLIESVSCQSIRLFHHFSALRNLRICGTKLTSMPESIRGLTSLESLTLNFNRIPALPEWLGDLSSLKGLVIEYCHRIKLLPESMRRLSYLESLTLVRCSGISALPEWLCDLSSLKSLVIIACYGIKSLPACIQQLTKLQKLEIIDCPNLKLENKAKLAHINVQVRDLEDS